jgi:hypothetical protein
MPFTVSVNPALPGTAAAGTRGLLTKGTGLAGFGGICPCSGRERLVAKSARTASLSFTRAPFFLWVLAERKNSSWVSGSFERSRGFGGGHIPAFPGLKFALKRKLRQQGQRALKASAKGGRRFSGSDGGGGRQQKTKRRGAASFSVCPTRRRNRKAYSAYSTVPA